MNKQISRILHGSPIATIKGKLVLGGFAVVLFIFAFSAFKDYYTRYPVQLLAGISMAFVMYIPTVIAVWYFDRREHEPWQLVLFVILSVTFFFGMVTSHVLWWVDKFFSAILVVGFIEDFWKMVPLLLLVFFVPRAVNGWRDGLVYGALGGLGFAILEFATNTTYEYFPEFGWAAFPNGMARFNFLGTHNHIIWSAAIGAAIGWAVTAPRNWKRYAVPLATYLGIAVLHIFEDKGGNILTTMISGAILEPLLMTQSNAEQLANSLSTPIQIYFGTVNLLIINIIPLIFLWRALTRSGDAERQVIRDQLKDEVGGAVTSEEYEGITADRRYRTRTILEIPKLVGRRIVQLQNELAFHKEFVTQRGGNLDTDPPVVALRQLIEAERAKVAPAGTVS